MTQHRHAALARRSLVAALLCAWLPACTGPADEPSGEPAPPPAVEVPATPAPSTEAYASASHEACDLYLGGLFSMAQADEELDTAAPDASRRLFMRRADDIAVLYAQYRSAIAALDVPEQGEVRTAHAAILDMMGENHEAIAALGEAYREGDEERAAALMGESARIEDAIAAVQTDLGIRPCGR